MQTFLQGLLRSSREVAAGPKGYGRQPGWGKSNGDRIERSDSETHDWLSVGGSMTSFS